MWWVLGESLLLLMLASHQLKKSQLLRKTGCCLVQDCAPLTGEERLEDMG